MIDSGLVNNSIQFLLLPDYAMYLLNSRFEEYTSAQLAENIKADVPLLRHFKHLSEEELFNLSVPGQKEFLTSISNNTIQEYFDASMKRWLSNQLPQVGKYDVEAKDITLINNSRSRALKKFLKDYTTDIDMLLALNLEIDDLVLLNNTMATDTYISLLKDKIEEESRFSSNIIQASPGLTFIYDIIKQREIFITGKVTEVTGFLPDEILALPNLISQIIHPDDVSIVTELIQNASNDTEGKTLVADYRVKTKDNSYQWMRVYAVVYMRDDKGAAEQLLGVCYNVTKEKEIARALQRSETLLLGAQSIAKLGSYEWDIINDTSVSTPELRKIFEVDHRMGVQEMMERVHEDDKAKVAASIADAMRTGTMDCEYRYQAKSGEKVIDGKAIVQYDKSGRPNYLIGTVQDVTERKRMEEQLIFKSLELERSNEQLQQFASVASHDLKEPLRKMIMFSDMIVTSEWDDLSEKTKNSLQRIIEASRRMMQLIEGILSYSTFSHQTKKENYSLNEAVKEAVNNLEYRISETKAIIEHEQLPELEAVPFQMQQLFQNLIANAIKFSKKEVSPHIRIAYQVIPRSEMTNVHLQLAQDYLKIEVKDNGIGFSSEVSDKIFGLFQRLHSKSAYEGTGLGLAICRKIVENHGGIIYASAKEGEGATFTIVLPFDKPKQ